VARRALFLALVAGGLATGVGALFGSSPPRGHDAVVRAAVLARGELADAPAVGLATRTRDALERVHELPRDFVAVLATVLASALAGGWWIARQRGATAHHARAGLTSRPRAPPRVPATVHC
jgi:hypothetical protein